MKPELPPAWRHQCRDGPRRGRRDGVNAKSRHSENLLSPVRRRSENWQQQELHWTHDEATAAGERGQVAQHHPVDDADLSTAIPMAINACYLNNGLEACIAASRLIRDAGRPTRRSEAIGQGGRRKNKNGRSEGQRRHPRPHWPALSSTSACRSTSIRGSRKVRRLVIGGEGHPQGLEGGNFVKPTVFANVTREMLYREGRNLRAGSVDTDVQDGGRGAALKSPMTPNSASSAYVSSADRERATRVRANSPPAAS